ncbi:MAG TPA: hypothetical protein EYN06_05880 [Myxococcales bacterium]|nr:hypothetical protein [Myxococcales bacterium]HIN85993.1 hypothetical protein [Myxococcales bacterium]
MKRCISHFWGVLIIFSLIACGPAGCTSGSGSSTNGDVIGNFTESGTSGGTADGVSTGDTGSTDGSTEPQCDSDADCPSGKPFCSATKMCVFCLENADCDGETLCFEGECIACKPGKEQCSGDKVVVCKADASGFELVQQCPEGNTCANATCLVCYPGTKMCEEGVAYICKNDGSGYEQLQDCGAAGLECAFGACLSPCGNDIKANTNAGCGFYAVDLDNALEVNENGTWDAQNAQFAVIASNTSDKSTAKVTVKLPDGTHQTKDVAPLSLETFLLPASFGQDGTNRSHSAFKIDSNLPITLYQFNPLSNAGVFSNDASVLLPVATLSGEYYVMSHKQLESKYRSYFTVVGVSEFSTDVTINVTATTMGGAGLPALNAGDSHTFAIEPGEVVNIESNAPGADLTGTHIKATGPIMVFGGHEAAVTGQACCADHLEQQMVPVSAWGTQYVVTRSQPRWKEKDYFRILASNNGTQITINPAVVSPPVITLNAGEFKEFQADSHFTVTANQPVMVVQFLASSQEIIPGGALGGLCFADADCPQGYTCLGICAPPSCNSTAQCPPGHVCAGDPGGGPKACQPIGDPAMILAVPIEQWRTNYVFLTPDSYVQDYINVVTELGANVKLDGVAISPQQFVNVPGNNYMVHRTLVSDGVHRLSSDKPAAITVYGFDKDVSYGYPGGLGVDKLGK